MQRLTNFGEEIDKDMKITPLASLLFLPALFSCVFQPEAEGALELPELHPTDRIVEYTGYVSSYNTETLIPDWVAYELTAEETEGTLSRDDRMFSMDRNFKGRQAMREDYYDSGWTKGHMAPAADLAWDERAMDESFYFMNVCPQKEYLNKKDWQYLEKQVRSWARRYGKVWVITGPIIGKNIYGTIGERNVVVPDAFFKACLVYTGSRYESIAFVMGNDEKRYFLADCAMTVDDLENITGIDFYVALPDEIEDIAENTYTLSVWGIK